VTLGPFQGRDGRPVSGGPGKGGPGGLRDGLSLLSLSAAPCEGNLNGRGGTDERGSGRGEVQRT